MQLEMSLDASALTSLAFKMMSDERLLPLMLLPARSYLTKFGVAAIVAPVDPVLLVYIITPAVVVVAFAMLNSPLAVLPNTLVFNN